MSVLSIHPATVLWIAGIVLDAVLVMVVLRRRIYTALPYFLAFVLVLGVRDLALLAVHQFTAPRYIPYFLTYWITDAIVVALRFLVLMEIFRDITFRYEGLFRSTGKAFRLAAGILAIIAIGSAIAAPGSGPSRMITGIQVFRRGVVLFEAGMLLTLLVFTSYFGMRWRKATFGVAVGLALYGALQLPMLTLAARSGSAVMQLAAIMNGTAYVSGLLIWILLCAGAEYDYEPALPIPDVSVLRAHTTVLELFRR